MAWSDEINSCSFRENAGPRKRSRPQVFCDSVQIQGGLTGTAAAFSGEVVCETTVTVGGVTYAPATVQIPGLAFPLNILVDVTQIPLLPPIDV